MWRLSWSIDAAIKRSDRNVQAELAGFGIDRLPLSPKTGSASERAGCRARSSSRGCYSDPSRRTFDPLRLRLTPVDGWVVLGDEEALEQQV